MVELLTLLMIVIVLGALLGGDSFGETIRTGCGCLGLLLFLAIIGLGLLLITPAI